MVRQVVTDVGTLKLRPAQAQLRRGTKAGTRTGTFQRPSCEAALPVAGTATLRATPCLFIRVGARYSVDPSSLVAKEHPSELSDKPRHISHLPEMPETRRTLTLFSLACCKSLKVSAPERTPACACQRCGRQDGGCSCDGRWCRLSGRWWRWMVDPKLTLMVISATNNSREQWKEHQT